MANKSGFKSLPEELRAQNIDAKAHVEAIVDVHDIFIPGDGHLLAHPRRNDPLDADLLYDIATRGVKEDVVLWREGMHGKKMRITLLDGCQRVNHLLEACRRMREGVPFAVFADGKPTGASEVIPWKDGRQYVPVTFHVGDVKSALLRRLGANSDPYKRPDSAAVLAAIITQGKLLHCTDAELFARMPREVDGAVYAALCRYDDLSASAKKGFADGAPVGLLPAIIDLPREEQDAALAAFVAAGVKTRVGASRVKNREERTRGGGNGEAIRPATLKKILATAHPTGDDIASAREVLDALRDKGSRASEETIFAHDTMAMYYFGLGAQFRGGDLSAIDGMPDTIRAALKKAAKDVGRTGDKKRGRPKKEGRA